MVEIRGPRMRCGERIPHAGADCFQTIHPSGTSRGAVQPPHVAHGRRSPAFLAEMPLTLKLIALGHRGCGRQAVRRLRCVLGATGRPKAEISAVVSSLGRSRDTQPLGRMLSSGKHWSLRRPSGRFCRPGRIIPAPAGPQRASSVGAINAQYQPTTSPPRPRVVHESP